MLITLNCVQKDETIEPLIHMKLLHFAGSILLVDFDREDFDLFTILIMTWKLFLLMFVSCGLAGIVVWFTVSICSRNPGTMDFLQKVIADLLQVKQGGCL